MTTVPVIDILKRMAQMIPVPNQIVLSDDQYIEYFWFMNETVQNNYIIFGPPRILFPGKKDKIPVSYYKGIPVIARSNWEGK